MSMCVMCVMCVCSMLLLVVGRLSFPARSQEPSTAQHTGAAQAMVKLSEQRKQEISCSMQASIETIYRYQVYTPCQCPQWLIAEWSGAITPLPSTLRDSLDRTHLVHTTYGVQQRCTNTSREERQAQPGCWWKGCA
jgi:hypothetical protein